MTELQIRGTEAKPTLLSESVSPTAHIDIQKSTSKQKKTTTTTTTILRPLYRSTCISQYLLLLVFSFASRMPLLTATSAFRLGRRRWSSPQQCYLFCLCSLYRRLSHTHPFNGPLSGTTRVSRYQKGKTNLDFTEARDSEWQRHQLGHMQICTSLQTDNHASTPPLSFFTGRTPFLPPNQQRQSTEGQTEGH